MNEKAGGRKFKRKLTPFLAHQMLYDYSIDQLDAERKAAVEEFLETDQEGRTILANLKQALAYVDKLGKAQIEPEILAQLKDAESPVSLGRRYSSWSQWPEPIRWSLTAIAISCVVAGIVGLIPWNMMSGLFHRGPKTPADVVHVAEIPRPSVNEIEGADEPVGSGDAPPEEESSGDEEMGDEGEGAGPGAAPGAIAKSTMPTATPQPTPFVKTTPTPLPTAAKAPVAIAMTTPSAPSAIAPATPVPATPTPHPTPTQAQQATSDEESGDTSPRDGKPKGFVYRAFMNVANIEEMVPQITDAIRGLGGEKAGEVELGWKRGGGRYYHFALPEENEKKLLDKLQAYGPVRISKDPHPRVMPQGRVRFILWVESQP